MASTCICHEFVCGNIYVGWCHGTLVVVCQQTRLFDGSRDYCCASSYLRVLTGQFQDAVYCLFSSIAHKIATHVAIKDSIRGKDILILTREDRGKDVVASNILT
jgi:hypothetical protein